MATARRIGAALLSVALTVLIAAGCSTDEGEEPLPPATEALPSSSSSPPQTSGPIPTEVASDDAVSYNYLLFWQAFINAQGDGARDHPALLQHATGQALAWAQESIDAYQANGWVRDLQEGYGPNTTVVERTDTTARLTDVQDWSKLPLVVRATGVIVEGSTPRQCITADLVRRGEVWVLSTIVFAQNTC